MGFGTQQMLPPKYERRQREKTYSTGSHRFSTQPKPSWSFLKPDQSSAGRWIEAGDHQAMKKTCRALLDERAATQRLATHFEKSKNEPGNQEEIKRPEKRVRFDGNGDTEPHIEETTPARLEDDLCNVDEQVRQPSNEYAETEDGIASVRTQETAKKSYSAPS
jgi:hypothetical protein